MKLTSEEYRDLLKRNPALAPDIEVKSKSYQKALNKFRDELLDQEFLSDLKPLSVPLDQETSATQAPTLKFTIPGQPVGSPRQTQRDKWMKRPCMVKYWAWCAKARASVGPGTEKLNLFTEVSFIAYMEFPKSYSVNKRADLTNQPHHQKPDIDNISKSVLDALFEDDKVIYKLSAEKRWIDSRGPRIEIELR